MAAPLFSAGLFFSLLYLLIQGPEPVEGSLRVATLSYVPAIAKSQKSQIVNRKSQLSPPLLTFFNLSDSPIQLHRCN